MKYLHRIIYSFLICVLSITCYANELIPPNEIVNQAKVGNNDAQVRLAYFFYKHQSFDQSLYWYKKAAANGDTGAQTTIALFYVHGYAGLEKNTDKALAILKPLAEKGVADAQYNIGNIYFDGLGIAKDYSKAKYWFEKAAQKNMPDALFNLGQIYYYGNGITPQTLKGFSLIKKSAILGYAPAQNTLSGFYGAGDKELGLAPSFIQDYQWRTLSYLNGYPSSQKSIDLWQRVAKKMPYCVAAGQANVGMMYFLGQAGLPQDYDKSFEWALKAYHTDPSSAEMKYNLVRYYLNAHGTTQDLPKAFKLNYTAAQSPIAPAQQQLAYLYLGGMGTEKDPIAGYAWLLLAQYTYQHPNKKYAAKFHYQCPGNVPADSYHNLEQVKRDLAKLNSELSRSQVRKAQVLFQKMQKQQEE